MVKSYDTDLFSKCNTSWVYLKQIKQKTVKESARYFGFTFFFLKDISPHYSVVPPSLRLLQASII